MSTLNGKVVMCENCEFSGDIPPGTYPTKEVTTHDLRSDAAVLIYLDGELRLSSHIVDANNPSAHPNSVDVRKALANCKNKRGRCGLVEAGYVPYELSRDDKRLLIRDHIKELEGVKLLGEALVLWES